MERKKNSTVRYINLANVVVTRQLSVYIQLIEATCLSSEAITIFILEHMKYTFGIFSGASNVQKGEKCSRGKWRSLFLFAVLSMQMAEWPF